MVGGDFLSRPRPCMGCSAWKWVWVIFIYTFISSTCTIVSIFIQTCYRNNSVIYPCAHCIYCLRYQSLAKRTGETAPFIPNLGTRRDWVCSFTLPPLDLKEGTGGSHCMAGWGPASVWAVCRKERCLWQESNRNPLVVQPLLYYTLIQLAIRHSSFQAVLYFLHSSTD
jgi:hypothetical protein